MIFSNTYFVSMSYIFTSFLVSCFMDVFILKFCKSIGQLTAIVQGTPYKLHLESLVVNIVLPLLWIVRIFYLAKSKIKKKIIYKYPKLSFILTLIVLLHLIYIWIGKFWGIFFPTQIKNYNFRVHCPKPHIKTWTPSSFMQLWYLIFLEWHLLKCCWTLPYC